MGIAQLFILIVFVALIGYAAVWALGKLAPSHPPIIDGVIWVVTVLLILVLVASALGLVDPKVPQLR